MKELGIEEGDRCAIYGKNSPLWLLCDLANAFANNITVPIYDTLGVDNIMYCLNLVKTRLIFTTSDSLGNVIGMADLIPTLEYIVLLDKVHPKHVIQ